MGIVAVIPARLGSRRVPQKNIRPLGGRPLVVWTISSALAARSLSRVIVSTESGRIAEIAARYGAEVVMRDAWLAGDNVSAHRVVTSAIESIECHAVAMLLPTSPFRTPDQIDNAVAAWRASGADRPVVSVTDRPDLHRTLRFALGGELRAETFLTRMTTSNGAIKVQGRDQLLASGSGHEFSANGAVPFVMDEVTGLDIDTEADWAVAEYYVRSMERSVA